MDTIFNDNPNLDVAYKTADGKYFYTENSAQNYALTLKNKEVKKVVRTEDATEKEEVKNEVVMSRPKNGLQLFCQFNLCFSFFKLSIVSKNSFTTSV